MKKILIIIMVLSCLAVHGQSDSSLNYYHENLVTYFDTPPAPEVGIDSFRLWINDNNSLVQISDTLKEYHKVYIQIIVDTTGTLSNIRVVRGIGDPFDNEALRLVSSCPICWSPATAKGKKVRVPFIIPVSFIPKSTFSQNKR
jgi:protein TonB